MQSCVDATIKLSTVLSSQDFNECLLVKEHTVQNSQIKGISRQTPLPTNSQTSGAMALRTNETEVIWTFELVGEYDVWP